MSKKKFKARHIDHGATITVELPKDEVVKLFSPEAQRRWVPGWKPQYFFRSDEDGPDTSFKTEDDGEESLWMVLDNDADEGSVGYARIVPGSRMGTLMVDVEPIDETSCWVSVQYELTSLSEAGNKLLKDFTPKAFKKMLAEWEQRIAELALA